MFRILIVEDEAIVALEIEDILTEAGHHVVGIADNEADALNLVAAGHPQLALVDVRLVDGESGVDVATALRGYGVPAMFVTGTCPRDGGHGVAVAGLHKPFSERGLLASIDIVRGVVAGDGAPATLPATLHLYRTLDRLEPTAVRQAAG